MIVLLIFLIMNIFKKFYYGLRLREAARKADKQHELFGNRFYVMPAADGRLIIMDKKNFRRLKHKHYISRDVSTADLMRECFYFTPFRNGDGFITNSQRQLKAKQYFDWIQATTKKGSHAK